MSGRNLAKTVLLVTILAGAATDLVQADKLQLQEKLSREVSIQLSNVTIAEALAKIGQKAGVKFVLSDEAVWRLPYGEATRLSVSLNGPLADSMTEMLNAFFMRYAVGDEEITIYPKPELEHILGKASAKQLELLKDIYTKPIKTYIVGNAQGAITKALGQGVTVIPFREYFWDDYLGLFRAKGHIEPNEAGRECELATPITVRQILDQHAATHDLGWYLSDSGLPNEIPQIEMVGKQTFRDAQLDQVVDVSYKDERAEVIIQKLAKRTGLPLIMAKNDPSWLDGKISVEMQNIRLRQALQNIVSMVDGKIEFSVRGQSNDGIFIMGPHHIVPHPVLIPDDDKEGRIIGRVDSGAGGCGYVGKISIPMDDGRYFIEFMLQECDMPEQLKALRAEKMKEILGEWPVPAKKKEPSASRSDANAVQGPSEGKSPALSNSRQIR